MEITLSAGSQQAMQDIVNKEWDFVHADYTDSEIKTLIRKFYELGQKDKTIFYDRVYWWDTPDSFFKKEKTVLGPIAKNYEKVIHRHLKEKDIDVNFFVNYFKDKGIKKYANYVEMICGRNDLVDQFSDDSLKILCSSYDYHKNEANLYNLSNRIRTLVIGSREATDSIFNLNDEVVSYLEMDALNCGYLQQKYFSVIRDEDLNGLSFSADDLVYIINKVRLNLNNSEKITSKLDSFLSKNKKSVTAKVQNKLYKKLLDLPDNEFINDIWVDNDYHKELSLFKFFNVTQINSFINRIYIRGIDNSEFLLVLKESVRDYRLFSQKILSIILNDIQNNKHSDNLSNVFSTYSTFVTNWQLEEFNEKNTKRLYDLMVSDTLLAQKMLTPSSYNPEFDFSFVKKYIVNPLQERRVGYILQLLANDKKLDLPKVLTVIGDVVNNSDIDNLGVERVYNIVDKMYNSFFLWQTKEDFNMYGRKCVVDDEKEALGIALQFIGLRLFHYLNEKNQYFIIKRAFYDGFSISSILEDAVVDNYFNKKQFDYIWENIGGDEKRCCLIGDVYEKCKFQNLNDNTLRTFNNYLEYNFDNFMDFYFNKRKFVKKPDFVIDHISNRVPFREANSIFSNKYLFERAQWKQMFCSFYTDASAAVVDEICRGTDASYAKFHNDYVKSHDEVEINCKGEVSKFSIDQFNNYFFGNSGEAKIDDSLFGKIVCPSDDGKRYVGVVQISPNDLLISSLIKDGDYPRSDDNNNGEIIYTRITYDEVDTIDVKQYRAVGISERVLDLAAESMPSEEFVEGYDYNPLGVWQHGLANIFVSEQLTGETLEFTIKNPIVARDFINCVRENVFDIKNPTWNFKDCLSHGEGVYYNAVNDDGCYYSGAIKVKRS